MKTIIRLTLIIGLVLGLSACSTISTRINEKSQVFYSLDADTRTKITRGDVDLGYTPDMVYIALGAPDLKRHRKSAQGSAETWIYRSYYGYDFDPYWAGGDWGWGGYYGGYGRHGRYAYGGFYGGHWPRMYGRHHDDDTRVTFQNGRVVMIDQPRT